MNGRNGLKRRRSWRGNHPNDPFRPLPVPMAAINPDPVGSPAIPRPGGRGDRDRKPDRGLRVLSGGQKNTDEGNYPSSAIVKRDAYDKAISKCMELKEGK